MPGTLYYYLSGATVGLSIGFSLVFAVIKVVAYLRFRLPSLLWLMIGGFWSLLGLPLIQVTNLLTKAMETPAAGGGRLGGQDVMRGTEVHQAISLVFVLIGYVLTVVFLVLLFRDLRRLLGKQRPVEVPPAE
jgi:hypothetical protein